MPYKLAIVTYICRRIQTSFACRAQVNYDSEQKDIRNTTRTLSFEKRIITQVSTKKKCPHFFLAMFVISFVLPKLKTTLYSNTSSE